MTYPTFLALIAFSFASSITPGPNNIMLFASGVNFGLRRSVPHMAGIAFGFAVLLGAVGLGLGVVVTSAPGLFLAIKIAGGAYMVYLAWRIFRSGPVEDGGVSADPMGFFAAALFQWVNPKAWVMAMVAMTAYTAEGDYLTNVAIVVAAFSAVNLPSISIWAGFGVAMRRLLADPKWLFRFNATMATLLILSLWPLLTA